MLFGCSAASRDGILKAKSEIFDFMADDGVICLNGEDDKLSTLREINGHVPHFFGLGGNDAEEVRAGEIGSHGLWGSDAVLHFDELDNDRCLPGIKAAATGIKTLEIHVPLPGRHMVLNAAAAACVARLFGLSYEEIAEGIGRVQPVSGRNHLIRLDRYTLIDDCYNANPASMRAALELLALADTRKIAILGDMFELGADSDALHAGVGEFAVAAGIDGLICVGENAIHIYEAAAEHATGKLHIAHFPTLAALFETLEQEKEEYVPEGSTILVKASHGMEFTKVLDFLKNL